MNSRMPWPLSTVLHKLHVSDPVTSAGHGMSATDKGCGSILHVSCVLQVGIRIPQLQSMVGTLTWAG